MINCQHDQRTVYLVKETIFRALHLLKLLRFFHRRKTIILLYHRFTHEGSGEAVEKNEDYTISIGTFERHLEHLMKHYDIIPLDDLIKHYIAHTKPPDNSLVITIDDGHESVYSLAYPILRRHRIPVTLFVVTDYIGGEKEVLGLNQLIEMTGSDFLAIGSHTCTHPLLTRCSHETLRKEVRLSKQFVEKHTGSNCHLFAYPYGGMDSLNKNTEELLKQSGYVCGLTAFGGMNDKHSGLFRLRRLDVSSERDLERFLRRAYAKESPLLSKLLKTFFIQLNSLFVFGRRLYYGYWPMNWTERNRNRKRLQETRDNGIKVSSLETPLVSVIIPTCNRQEMLLDRSIPSVMNQTYQNFEIIVVGDHCTDDTSTLVRKIGDKRIRFYNLPTKTHYPLDSDDRKLVAGTGPANKALELCRGNWITRLDDDDEFSNDHIETLLNHALRYKYELVYGRVEIETRPNQWITVGSYPPKRGQMAHIGVLYNSKLRFFQYDTNAWKYVEPDDWNLFRRMIEAGVKIGFVDKVVGRAYLGKRRDRLS